MPLLLFPHLVLLVLILQILNHRVLLCLKLQLILEHELAISLLLHGPKVFLLTLSFSLIADLPDLIGLSGLDVLDLVRAQTLEVVGKEAVLSETTGGGLSCLSHEMRIGGVGDLLCILLLLGPSLCVLLVPLGLSLEFEKELTMRLFSSCICLSMLALLLLFSSSSIPRILFRASVCAAY